jgi:uncharacterized protein (DUF1778 family)
MAVVPYTIDSAATGTFFLPKGSAASSVTTMLRDAISDSSNEHFELPREIRMSRRDFKLFLVEVDSDEEPNDTLRQAAEEYKRKYGNE